ncbi:MAG TPA: NUMOD4 motif-containing HNH endonuclease [Terricaulis sp.]|nr:NUMOD4 motif-containing HNH endonuclease [Terricaulis sp.]
MSLAEHTPGAGQSERWAKVPGEPYFVSTLGRVRRLGGSIRKLHTKANGYQRVSIGHDREAYVHRLVCLAFYGPPPTPTAHADHINGDRADNRLENLRWLSPEENRARRKVARGEQRPEARLTADDIRAIRASTQPGTVIAPLYGVSHKHISSIRLRKVWKHV